MQITVKSTWPDGSAKIAILAGGITAAGASTTVNLGTGQPPAGPWLTLAQLVASGITASITSDAYGSATWLNADFGTPFTIKPGLPADEQYWAVGPHMLSFMYRKPFSTDDHLTGWLEVRLFSTGDVEVLPWLENGYLLKAAPGGRSGTFTFTLGGSVRFGPTALTVSHHTRGVLVSGSALSHWLGEDKTVVPKHDAAYLAATGLTQAFDGSLERNWSALPASKGVSAEFMPFEPFTTTNTIHSTSMGQAGGHDSIGLQPAWEAIALLDDSVLGFTQMVRESYRFGNMQIHYRDEATNRPIRFSEHADTALHYEWNVSQNMPYIEGGGSVFPPNPASGTGGESERFKPSHQPAAPLLAYITTGRFFFMEECQHIAGINFLLTAIQRNGSDGLLDPNASIYVEIRHVAWAFRNYAIAACVTPDDDPLKPDLDNCVSKNVDHYHAKYVAGPGNPFGIIERQGSGFGGDQAWQYDFWTAAWGRAIAMRVGASVAVRKKAREFFYWVSRSIVGRLGGTSESEFHHRHATCALISNEPYLYPGALAVDYNGSITPAYPDYDTGTGPWWASWGAYYDAWIVGKHEFAGAKVDGPLESYSGSPLEDNNGWWAMVNVAATICASLSAPGAAAGLARIQGASNWSSFLGGFTGQRPGNGTVAVTLPLEYLEDLTPAPGTRLNVHMNDARSVDYDRILGDLSNFAVHPWTGYSSTPAQTFNGITYSYSGNVWADDFGPAGGIVHSGGGHGAFIGSFLYAVDADTMTWRSIGAMRNTPPNLEYAGYANPASGTRTEGLEQRDVTWMDYLWNGSRIKFSDHTYLQNAYVSRAEGGGRQGSIYLPQSTFSQDPGVPDPRTGVSYRYAPHTMDLSTGLSARTAATPGGDGSWVAYAGQTAIKDTTRSKLWFFLQSQSFAWRQDLAPGLLPSRVQHFVQKISGGTADAFGIYNSVGDYCPEADCIVIAQPGLTGGGIPVANGTLNIRVLSMATGVPVDLERTNAIGVYPFLHGGCAVLPMWFNASDVGALHPFGAFYFYEGHGDEFATVLEPSSLNFQTCTWAWSRESFTGPTPPNRHPVPQIIEQGQLHAPWGRARRIPKYRSFMWHDGPDTQAASIDGVTRYGVIQLWRPPGVPI